jgi:hypothetical protein
MNVCLMPTLEEWAEDLRRKGFQEVEAKRSANIGVISAIRPDGRTFRGILTRELKSGAAMRAIEESCSAEVVMLLVPFGKGAEAAQLARLSGDRGKIHVEEFMA